MKDPMLGVVLNPNSLMDEVDVPFGRGIKCAIGIQRGYERVSFESFATKPSEGQRRGEFEAS